jgi:hypothetical protein
MRFDIVTIFPGFFERDVCAWDRPPGPELQGWSTVRNCTICGRILRTTGIAPWTTARLAAAKGWC